MENGAVNRKRSYQRAKSHLPFLVLEFIYTEKILSFLSLRTTLTRILSWRRASVVHIEMEARAIMRGSY